MFAQSYSENMARWSRGNAVVPDWPNQLWYSQFCDMITKDVLLPPRQDLLLSPIEQNISHPLHQSSNSLGEAVGTTHNSERVQDLLLVS